MPNVFDRRRFLVGSAAVGVAATGGLVLDSEAGAAQPGTAAVLVNNVGYEPHGVKRAVIAGRSAPGHFRVVDALTGKTAYKGKAHDAGEVRDWGSRRYWIADFSGLRDEGTYVVEVNDGTRSAPFLVEGRLLQRYTLSHVTHYFKGSRCSGQFDKFDHSLPVQGSTQHVDAHGGWYDATGDFGKHFTQLSNLSYFNTLSIPLTAWVLFASYRLLAAREDPDLTQIETWLLDEAIHGADYLARVHVAGGSFYGSVSQPGPPKDPIKRTLSPHQVNFREGGGVAIAALAAASTYDVSGDYASADYLAAAKTRSPTCRPTTCRLSTMARKTSSTTTTP